MEFRVKKYDLLKILQATQNITEVKTTLPLGGSIFINATLDGAGSRLEIYATSPEIGIKAVINCTILSPGSIIVNGKQLNEIIKALPNEEIHIVLNNEWMEISCLNIFFKIPSVISDDFQFPPSPGNMEYLEIDALEFKDIIKRVVIAISPDKNRPALNGALFSKKEDKLIVIGSDGRKFSMLEYLFTDEKNIGMSFKLEDNEDILIPQHGLFELIRLIEGDGNILFGIQKSHSFFQIENMLLSIRMIGYSYPDYKVVLPKGNDKRLTLGKECLLSALKRISLLSEGYLRMMKFSLKKGILELFIVNSTHAQADERIDVDYDNDALEIGMNTKYLIELLNVVEGKIYLDFKDDNEGIIITFEKHPGFKYIIMPMELVKV